MTFIELKDVSFTYPDEEKPSLSNVSLKINKGQFIVLLGASGSGKTTLLRLLKKEIQPHGTLRGEVNINSSTETGFVFQDPENQVVAEEVLHELVFGLENIGVPPNEMRGRVAEMVHFFGVENILHQKIHELSGGRKQQINLASVLLMQPDILLLDEPTSQLDPVSAREFLNMLERLNEEFGMTIILAEHRLEEIITLADKLILMDKGSIRLEGPPKKVVKEMWNSNYHSFVPTIPSLFFQLNGEGEVPLSVKEGRKWAKGVKPPILEPNPTTSMVDEIIRIKNVSFRYDRKKSFILDNLQFTLNKGEFYTILGGNGSGKSTFMKVIGGMLKPENGKVILKPKLKIGYLPQNPKLFFIQDTVEKEIECTIGKWDHPHSLEIENLLNEFELNHLVHHHPYDLSGGEIQKAALLCILIKKPEILLLDEPTKGLDPISKENLARILLGLKSEGITIVMSTHDLEFAARYATKCGMIFQGKIISEETPENFFKGNFFYTTMYQRIFRGLFSHGKERETCEK